MNILLRIIWFFIIGFWLGLLWFMLCLFLCLTIIFLPIGAYAMTKTWKLMTLAETPKQVIVQVENKVENRR